MAERTETENQLFEWYRTYIGEPDARTDVYLGFGLFFGGIALGVIALVLFLWGSAAEPRTGAYFARMGPAYTLGMLSLPAAMTGIVVLLPVEKKAQYAAAVGGAINLLAVVGFNVVYPDDWNGYGADYTMEVVATYATGLTVVVGATGAALVAHQLAQVKPGPGDIEVSEDEDDEGETISDEQIESDIESAMEGVDMSWGGVEKHEGRKISVNTDTDIDVSGMDVEAETSRSSGVDSQVQGLRQMKGGEKKTATSESTVDDQTAKLNELRQQKREDDEAASADDGGLDGLLSRLRSKLGLG
ncbi:DUF7139 domain-containing protein [Halostella litorea]|uniref:DUF7139 domain-containing protein n=1 Tax=Halostella litorea TaxID=2528831 RepID=UPI001092FE3A|nr:permease [Halostella litorea]